MRFSPPSLLFYCFGVGPGVLPYVWARAGGVRRTHRAGTLIPLSVGPKPAHRLHHYTPVLFGFLGLTPLLCVPDWCSAVPAPCRPACTRPAAPSRPFTSCTRASPHGRQSSRPGRYEAPWLVKRSDHHLFLGQAFASASSAYTHLLTFPSLPPSVARTG